MPAFGGRHLAFRVTLLAAIVLFPFAVGVAVLSLSAFERQALEGVGHQQSLLVRRLAADLDQRLEASRTALHAVALEIPEAALTNPDLAQRALDSHVALRSLFDNGLFLFNNDGRLVAESPFTEGGRGREIAHREQVELPQAQGETYISTPYSSAHARGQPGVVIGALVRDGKGRVIGRLHGGLLLLGKNFLADLSTARVGKGGFFFLATKERTLISHPDPSRIMGPLAERGTNPVLDRAIDEGFDGWGETRSRDGTPMLLGVTALRATGWILGAFLPLAEARAPFRALARVWTVVLVCATAIMFAVLVLLVRRAALPLTRMTAEVEALASADSPAGHVSAGGPAEATRLAGAFNKLLAVLAAREREARAAANRAQRLFDESPLPGTITDAETGRILDVNRAFLAKVGLGREAVVGRSAKEVGLVSGEQPEAAGESALAAKDGVAEVEGYLPSGERVVLRVTNHRMEIEGRPVVLSVTEDLTEVLRAEEERRKLEAQVQQQQRLESLGVLAGGIAHDFNNLLTPIIASADLALRELPEDHPIREDLEEIARAGKRGAELTRRILVFGRRQMTESTPLDLNEEVRIFERMLRRLLGEDVELKFELAPGPCQIRGDATQVQQVVMNLAVNARQAMPRGGQLIIATREVAIEAGAPWTRKQLKPGRYAILTVSDTGTGIPKEVLERIFEPFFTTKGRGEGSGLGLATVLAIAHQHGGDVTVHSEVGRGSTFNVYLPLAAAEEPDLSKERGLPPGALARDLSTTRVLVVEDNPSVRALLVRILRGLGCAVLEAASPAVALGLPDDPRPDLLVTDVVMPGVDGIELHRRLSARWPEIPAVFVSGFPAGVATVEEAMAHGRHFLPKPFDVQSLERMVREALGAASASAVSCP